MCFLNSTIKLISCFGLWVAPNELLQFSFDIYVEHLEHLMDINGGKLTWPNQYDRINNVRENKFFWSCSNQNLVLLIRSSELASINAFKWNTLFINKNIEERIKFINFVSEFESVYFDRSLGLLIFEILPMLIYRFLWWGNTVKVAGGWHL